MPNLQSELLLSSLAALTASFAANDHRELLREWRERWSEALQEARTPAMVGLALAALRQRCAVFGLLFDEEPPRAAELELQNSSWYHAGAFLRFKKHTKRGPPAGRRGGEK